MGTPSGHHHYPLMTIPLMTHSLPAYSLPFSAFLPPESSRPASGCAYVPVNFTGTSAPFGFFLKMASKGFKKMDLIPTPATLENSASVFSTP
jgi:hypothetical protein